MTPLQKKLERLQHDLDKAKDDDTIEKLEQEIEKVERALLRPVHTDTDEVEDDEDSPYL